MKKHLGALALAAALVMAGPAVAAFATGDDGYTPGTPTVPTLAGSTAGVSCVKNAPYIQYSVTMTDPDEVATGHTAYLLLADAAGHSVDLELGALVNDHLSGSILWPGASVDANGNGNGWPGWVMSGGAWQQTTGNFAWTRGAITATLHVNPSVVVPLSYPPATALCANPASVGDASGVSAAGGSALAVTGATVPWLAAGVGTAALAVGGILLVLRRRRAEH